ncbi:MAG TPA: hypothetical protein VKU90_06495 [Caulobacteraceae bacterium]|nr:hypothetical protein [Caulobacteraceae bacterium]
MIRSVITGIAAFTLMSTSVAVAQDDTHTVVVYHRSDPVVHVVRGGVIGAGLGAAIGCLVTLPVCGPGAAVGATIGGGGGAVVGAARSADQDETYRTERRE